jgi:peroxiredoxin Q/BCP
MKKGDLVPDFTLSNQEGESRSLDSFLAKGPVVLFFYPAAMTAGCTKESCHFRDLGAAFSAVGAQRVGISMDSVQRQAQFSAANTLDYPLLADVGGAVAKIFGVKRALDLLKVKRTTFVIGQDHRVLEVISSETNMNAHAEKALSVLASANS